MVSRIVGNDCFSDIDFSFSCSIKPTLLSLSSNFGTKTQEYYMEIEKTSRILAKSTNYRKIPSTVVVSAT